MKHQLKYLKLFEGLSPEDIPYSKVHDDGTMDINIPSYVKELPPIFNELTDEVTWDLSIKKNKFLTEVTGFTNLTRVGGALIINYNKSLTSVTGFNNLTQVGWDLSIDNNESLTEVTGFNSLTRVGDYLIIEENQSLTEVTGFTNLTEIGRSLWIQNNPKLVAMSIPGSLVRSVNYSRHGIRYDNNLFFTSPPEFINSPVVINNLVEKFNPGYHSTLVIKQIIENLKEWGTQATINTIVARLTPEQMELFPDDFKHLYHPDYKNTSVRDVAKLNAGIIYGIF